MHSHSYAITNTYYVQKLVMHSCEPAHVSCKVGHWLGTLDPVVYVYYVYV